MIIRFPRHRKETFFIDHIWQVIIASFGLLLLSYFFIDVPMALYVRTHLLWIYPFAAVVSESIYPKYQYFIWPVLFLSFRYLMKSKRWAQRSLIIAISIPVANLLTEILKVILGRARPILLFNHEVYGFTWFSLSNEWLSFPSGHACTIGAICGAFACFYPKHPLLWLAIAMLLGSTRLLLLAHFLSDVIAGVVLGCIVAQWVYMQMMKTKTFIT